MTSLLDFLQGVSNGVAANVSAPVDGIAWLLRKTGLPIDTPVGGSDWMRAKGLTAEPQNQMAGLLGEAAGGVAPMLAAAKFNNIIQGLLGAENAGSRAINNVANNLQSYRQTGKMDTLASHFVGKEPIPQPQRPFNVDYPQAIGSSPGSRLTTSIDGSPLSPTAAIAGRSTVGGADQAIGNAGIRGASENIGAPWNFVPQRLLPKNTVGTLNPATREVNVLETLTGYGQARTGGHEFSHLIDDISGKIPTKGIESPLSQMFSELNTQGYVSKWQKGATPELYGYKGADVGREKMAEAIYAYLRDPNYIKSKFPDVAKRIREYVNTNPNLKDVIQFNSAGGLAAGGLLGNEYSKGNIP